VEQKIRELHWANEILKSVATIARKASYEF
jgi:hypothetical protein